MKQVTGSSTSSAPRVQKARQRLRQKGMRSIQIWVPDTRSDEFKQECRRQAQNVAANQAHEKEVMDWVEGVADTRGWDA